MKVVVSAIEFFASVLIQTIIETNLAVQISLSRIGLVLLIAPVFPASMIVIRILLGCILTRTKSKPRDNQTIAVIVPLKLMSVRQ